MKVTETFNIFIHSIMCERQVFKGWVYTALEHIRKVTEQEHIL